MFKLIFFVLVLSVAGISGYDFKDSDYNEIISDDFQNNGLKRSKRDTELNGKSEKWKNNFHCCNGDTFDDIAFGKYVVAKEVCVKELWGTDEEPSYDPFNCDQIQELKQQGLCLAQCVMAKLDLLNDTGNIKRDELIEHLKIVFKDSEWNIKATEGIVDKCLASLDQVKIDENKCNPNPMNFIHCLWKGYIQSCPTELQNNELNCKKIREKIEKNDKNYLKKIHFMRFIRHHDHENVKNE